MAEERAFGGLLKRYRRAAHLTQQDLADRAGYSSHYVSMLERGVRVPQPLTVDLLAHALQLPDEDRASLHAAAEVHRQIYPPPGLVPAPPVPLVGREDELARLLGLLQQRGVRLVTLTGPGGVGKTALARHAASALEDVFHDGVAFVDLTDLTRPEDVIPTIARTLGVREMGVESIRARLIAFLQDRTMVIVLDCFERVTDAAQALAELLIACTEIKVLATSRMPLRLQMEHELHLGPLALPVSGSSRLSGLLDSPAVGLFVQRARLLESGVSIDNGRAEVIADICRRVDGLPLAIELAAARVTHLPFIALRDRLQQRLHVLTGGSRDLPARQQRMRDCIAWSDELLTPAQQRLFRRLSVFVGTWSLECAEEVCGDGATEDTVLDGMRVLVESNLVTMSGEVLDEARYRMLDTIQEYAAEGLAASDELHEIRHRHSSYYVHLAEQAEPALQDRDQRLWYTRLEREHGNIRAALSWLLQVGNRQGALRLAGGIWRFWQLHGDVREGRRWLEEGLKNDEQVTDEVRAKALWGAGWLAYHEGDYSRTKALATELLRLAEGRDDALSMRNAFTLIGMVALAEARYQEALGSFERALHACQSLGGIWHRATSLLNLGTAAMLAGELDRAAHHFEEALLLYRERGDELFEARVLHHLGYVALLQREYERARMLCARSLQMLYAFEDGLGIADALDAVAAVCAATGEAERAGRIQGAVSVLREQTGGVPLPAIRAVWYPFERSAAESVGKARWEAARDEGRRMSLQEAVLAGVREGSSGNPDGQVD